MCTSPCSSSGSVSNSKSSQSRLRLLRASVCLSIERVPPLACPPDQFQIQNSRDRDATKLSISSLSNDIAIVIDENCSSIDIAIAINRRRLLVADADCALALLLPISPLYTVLPLY